MMPTFSAFVCLELENGALELSEAHLGLEIKPPEHFLDVVLVSLLVVLDDFHALH